MSIAAHLDEAFFTIKWLHLKHVLRKRQLSDSFRFLPPTDSPRSLLPPRSAVDLDPNMFPSCPSLLTALAYCLGLMGIISYLILVIC